MNEMISNPNKCAADTPFFELRDRADGALEFCFLTAVESVSPDGKKTTDRINIHPSRYEQIRALGERFRNRTVVATGRGPVEGYFAVGYYATVNGATQVVFEGANAMQRIEMAVDGVAPQLKPWLQTEVKDENILVTITKPTNVSGKWSDSEIDYSSPALLERASQSVIFTGVGAVAMYLLLGVSAARAGLTDVGVAKPSNPGVIQFTLENAGKVFAIPNAKKGVVVGIIGDPNSGKSVFSRAFYMALRDMVPNWYSAWIYDCDLASPTPEWYCAAQSGADAKIAEEYKAIRDSQKVSWNSDLESRCARDLGVLRTNLDLVIADLPGGRHKNANGPLANPVRIDISSDSRRPEMFRQCDAFVLICRKDKREQILKGWREALRAVGLENRLMAVFDSSDPNGDFFISPLIADNEGVLQGEIRGLDRSHPAGETGLKLSAELRPLLRSLMAIPVISAARAATATAFLTGDKGTRYGAAVRSTASGRIYAAGQYSSFNHSTNLHAEMNALSQAAIAGEPDVDILAITSTSAAEASPCGVCRQVIIEHAARTGRNFDVALTTPGKRPVLLSASELLPHAWSSRSGATGEDVRDLPSVKDVFTDNAALRVGSEFIETANSGDALSRIALVWDEAFAPDTAICKMKYEQLPDGRWRKLPHAFTESAQYLRYLCDIRRGSGTFTGLIRTKLSDFFRPSRPVNYSFKHPLPLSGEMLKMLDEALFSAADIDAANSVFVTCSRMTRSNTDASDWDLKVIATPEQIAALRSRVIALSESGRVTFPDKSRSWKLLKAYFPGATADGGARIHAEGRYAESFRLDGIPVSFLFTPPPTARSRYAFPTPYMVVGRAAITGKIIDDVNAPYKRSESVVETEDHRRVRLLCYHKTGNLLKCGDRISATGVLCRHLATADVIDCGETLVLSAPALDRLVWMM